MKEVFQNHFQELGFEKQTAIQKAVYDPLRSKTSVVGLAPTGSGKTLAFTIPMLELIESSSNDLQAIIIEPSAELAMQTFRVISDWSKLIDVKVSSLIGGVNISRQIDSLKNDPQIIVGTTGRIENLVNLGKISFKALQVMIIDEADNLLSEDTLKPIRNFVDLCPQDVCLGFFSATESDIVAHLNRWFNQEIQRFDVREIDDTRGKVDHRALEVSNQKKPLMLLRFLHVKGFRALVFFNEIQSLEKTNGFLKHHHVDQVATLTSEQRQVSRQKSLNGFKKGTYSLLLTTDVAARGIDVIDLPAVINYDLPKDSKTYIHRVGRTGRMHHDGIIINMGDDHDIRDLKKLLVGSDFNIKKIYFKGNQLSDSKPKIERSYRTQEQKNFEKKEFAQDSKPVIQAKHSVHPKKGKHSKRKGMRHKRKA